MRNIVTRAILCVGACLWMASAGAFNLNEDEKGVERAIALYLNGSSYNLQEEIRQAFYPSARLYLDGKDNGVRELSPQEYASLFPDEKKSQFNGRIGRLISIDVSDSVATAKAEILMPKPGIRFIDVFLLNKIKGSWQIISKTTTSRNGPQHGRRIAMVVSSADRYPGTTVNAGNNFPELAYAYRSFTEAGYAVDFISPDGGAIALEAINSSDALQKRHLYDSDFMWALAHTRPVAGSKAADYAAVLFAGGGAAIVGVPDNQPLQTLAMAIYRQGGVIAAICQGTEGLTRLKNADGTFLISGKVLTSFPDAFLNKSSPIFKAYPFSVEGSIRERGGKFTHGANGSSHVEVDGRLVTGMNWESSEAVARKVVELTAQVRQP